MRDPPTAPAAMIVDPKKRPKLDLNVVRGERKRGKSMFGVLLNTLNKAKAEDKERNASEAVCNPSSRILRLITHILKYIHTL